MTLKSVLSGILFLNSVMFSSSTLHSTESQTYREFTYSYHDFQGRHQIYFGLYSRLFFDIPLSLLSDGLSTFYSYHILNCFCFQFFPYIFILNVVYFSAVFVCSYVSRLF
jgi:hypothetical protein